MGITGTTTSNFIFEETQLTSETTAMDSTTIASTVWQPAANTASAAANGAQRITAAEELQLTSAEGLDDKRGQQLDDNGDPGVGNVGPPEAPHTVEEGIAGLS